MDPLQMGTEAISVTALNEYIKMKLEGDPFLNRVLVKGEISNFVNHYKTGHFYLSLKDEGGVVRAVMFRTSAQKLPFVPENGMKVICRGRISSTYNNHDFIFIKSAITMCAVMNAVAYQLLFFMNSEHSRISTACNNHCFSVKNRVSSSEPFYWFGKINT